MSNIEVLSKANDWINAGHKVALATVLKTWGSAPRRAGSQLAIRDDGHMIGSVSGGCVEGDVVANALELNTRAADAIGIPLEAPSVDGRNSLAKRFGFDSRAGGFAPYE